MTAFSDIKNNKSNITLFFNVFSWFRCGVWFYILLIQHFIFNHLICVWTIKIDKMYIHVWRPIHTANHIRLDRYNK